MAILLFSWPVKVKYWIIKVSLKMGLDQPLVVSTVTIKHTQLKNILKEFNPVMKTLVIKKKRRKKTWDCTIEQGYSGYRGNGIPSNGPILGGKCSFYSADRGEWSEANTVHAQSSRKYFTNISIFNVLKLSTLSWPFDCCPIKTGARHELLIGKNVFFGLYCLYDTSKKGWLEILE